MGSKKQVDHEVCPFCKAEPSKLKVEYLEYSGGSKRHENVYVDDMAAVFISCGVCGAKGPLSFFRKRFDTYPPIDAHASIYYTDSAWAAWDKR